MPDAAPWEYVMLKGVNDSMADARELVRLIRGIPSKINLIPFNPWPGSPFERSDWDQIEKFSDYVNAAGYASPIRRPRGVMTSWPPVVSSKAKVSGPAPASVPHNWNSTRSWPPNTPPRSRPRKRPWHCNAHLPKA